MFYSHKKENTYITYKSTFLTFEAANQTRRYKCNRQISYGPSKLQQLDKTSKLISHFTCLFPGVKLTTHPHLVPRSWMSRSYASTPPGASMACSGTALLYLFIYYLFCWGRAWGARRHAPRAIRHWRWKTFSVVKKPVHITC
jgi:hypothetical protein